MNFLIACLSKFLNVSFNFFICWTKNLAMLVQNFNSTIIFRLFQRFYKSHDSLYPISNILIKINVRVHHLMHNANNKGKFFYNDVKIITMESNFQLSYGLLSILHKFNFFVLYILSIENFSKCTRRFVEEKKNFYSYLIISYQ